MSRNFLRSMEYCCDYKRSDGKKRSESSGMNVKLSI